ncbi:MAG: hypothetical protein M1338_05675 [Patescibacteria group bacterium]|nr:hypothetical protein [Patescibacteria group bacterium]
MEERDNKWLRERLQYLHQRYFYDVDILNTIIIKFGRPAMTRLGSIKPGRKYKDEHSIITINGHFKNPEIPSFVVDAVIAHEFMHYAHGFCSPHERAFKHPHKGGVVNWDMKERGLEEILAAEKLWLKENWENYLRKNHHKSFSHQSTPIISLINKIWPN